MATQTTVTTVDDLDGSGDAETRSFALDGKTYEIDLSKENQIKLEEALDPFIAAARNAGRAAARGRRGRSSASESQGTSGRAADQARNQAIRQWAQENGHTVSQRGRISKSVVDAYEAAH